MNLGKETELVEFKESTSQTSRALEALAAMLNKHGKGTVYFGVSDNGDIKGQTIGTKTLKDLSEAITTRIKPSIIPSISIEKDNTKAFIKVDVSGHNKPYSADGNYLIRSGCENKKIDPEQLKTLVFTNSAEHISEMESINQDLTFNQLKQLYISQGMTINNDTFAKNMGLLCLNGKYNELANILSDNNDCSIKVVRFAGIDKSEMISRNEYGYKCLIIAMQQALDFVNSFNETRVEVGSSLKRKEHKLFDSKALREAWVNACLHTKWAKMIPPAIYIFQNRIEIISTGGLPLDFTTEDFFNGISHPINKQLQKIMGQLGIVEQTGHGVPEIIKAYGKKAFKISDNNIIVTLKFPFELPNFENDISKLSPSQKKVYETIKFNPYITKLEIAKITDLSSSHISNIVKVLKELNYISRVGALKNGYWKIIK